MNGGVREGCMPGEIYIQDGTPPFRYNSSKIFIKIYSPFRRISFQSLQD